MKYANEITSILSLALSGRTRSAESKLNILINTIEYEGDAKTARKLRKALPKPQPVPKAPVLFQKQEALDKADSFIKAIRMRDILEAEDIPVPALLIISGPEGSGRSTLIEYIAAILAMPVVDGEEPEEGKILHIKGECSEERLEHLARGSYITVYECTERPAIDKALSRILFIDLEMPGDEEKKAFIKHLSKLDNISRNGMKVLLKLFENSDFSDMKRIILEARRESALSGKELSYPDIALRAALALPGMEDQGEGEKELLRKRAKHLRALDPDIFSIQAIADIFSRPKASMHYILSS